MSQMKSANLAITNRCNFNCSHCSVNAGINKKELSFNEINRIYKKLKKLGFEKIDIGGGEPLLRKDIVDIVSAAKRQGFEAKILTNGSLVSENLLKKLNRAHLDGIAVSLDSVDFDTERKIRCINKKTFSTVIKNIKNIKKFGFYTKINCVLCNSTMHRLNGLISFCEKNKIDELRICYFLPIGRGASFRRRELVPPLKWLKYIKKNLNSSKKTKIFVGALIAKKGTKNTDCLVHNNENLDIFPDKKAYVCPVMKHQGKSAGKIDSLNLNVKHKRACFPLLKNFFRKNYIPKGYQFVCPLRKFLTADVT